MHTIEIIGQNKILFDGTIINRSRIQTGSRRIFKTKEVVIKLDNHSGYCVGKQGKYESEKWEEIKESEYSKYFVPLLQSGCIDGVYYTIQPRVKTKRYNRKVNRDFYYILRDIENALDLWDISTNPGNWTIQNGNPLIFDYGFGA